MFQNIDVKNADTAVNEEESNYNKGKFEIFNSIMRQALTKQNLFLYLVSFMMSMVSAGDGMAPFGMAIFAAACSNSIPVIFIYTVTMIGTALKFGSAGVLNYLLISLLFVAMILIFKPWYQEEYKNERRKLGRYVFLATLIINTIEVFFNGFLVYTFLLGIATSITTYIFYKIFSESLIVIREWGIKEAFSIEEIMGAALMVSVALLAISNVTLFGLNVGQVLMIIIILVLGWKNGIMVGATAGITIGTVIGIIGNAEPMLIASFALSGMIAGILNRFGKIGVIIGFMLGNALLTYIYNGNTVAVIYFKEILVASLGLILVPKNIKINIDDLFDKSSALPHGPIYKLTEDKYAASKLNNVSDAIQVMSDTYKDEKEEKDPKEIFLNELSNRLEKVQDNVLYEDMYNFNNGIAEDTYNLLRKKQKITNIDLQDVFKNHSAYIVTLDNTQDLEEINKNTQEITNIINEAYKISNVTYIWKQKIDESKKVMSDQLENVSEAISNIAKEIEKDQNKFTKESAKIKLLAENNNISIVDLKIKNNDERYLINLYTDKCKDECYIEKIEEILSQVLEDEIKLQKKECAIDEENNVCKQIYSSQDKYMLRVGIAKKTKEKSVISGDTYIKTKLDDGKNLIALSDGMGSGPDARKSSKVAIKMLERLLKTGFEKDASIKLINSTMCLNAKDDMYATLDIAIFDLFKGNIEIVKNGSCPTFVKSKKDVQLIKSLSLPAGILDDIDLVTFDRDLEDGDIVVMCTDGIIDSNTEYNNKEMWVKDILSEMETDDVQKIADIIVQEAVDNNLGRPKDDMTVIVAKIIKK
ncbi:MAG: SpoIIE family protein phosphatase [Clostridia bacterium]|nr:SpoIIE family protein phosphatase [Clostridia bacterium]